MALLKIFRKGKSGEQLAQTMLSDLGEKKEPVRVEIEGTPMYFPARLTLRQGSVVVTRPEEASKLLKPGGWIRVRPGQQGGQELRLQISSSSYGPQKTAPYFMCKIPGATAEQAKRSYDRLSTTQFKNLILEIHHHPYRYRILDVSMRGMRVRLMPAEAADLFPVGTPQEYASILLGQKGKIQLQSIVARHHYTKAVGIEMEVSAKGNSAKWLEVFLSSLDKAAVKRSDDQAAAADGEAAGTPAASPAGA